MKSSLLTLRRTMFVGVGRRAAIAPSWISNGHFAIHKSRVANAAIFRDSATVQAALGLDAGNISEMTDDNMERLIPRTARLSYLVTRWCIRPDGIEAGSRLLIGDDGDFAFIGDDYCSLLDLQGQTLFATTSGGRTVFADDRDGFTSFLLMPVRGESVDVLLRSLGPKFFEAQAADELRAKGIAAAAAAAAATAD